MRGPWQPRLGPALRATAVVTVNSTRGVARNSAQRSSLRVPLLAFASRLPDLDCAGTRCASNVRRKSGRCARVLANDSQGPKLTVSENALTRPRDGLTLLVPKDWEPVYRCDSDFVCESRARAAASGPSQWTSLAAPLGRANAHTDLSWAASRANALARAGAQWSGLFWFLLSIGRGPTCPNRQEPETRTEAVDGSPKAWPWWGTISSARPRTSRHPALCLSVSCLAIDKEPTYLGQIIDWQ